MACTSRDGVNIAGETDDDGEVGAISLALGLAEKAVQHEKHRQLDQAYFLYEKAVELLEKRLAELSGGEPEHHAVAGLVATYRMRAQELHRQCQDIGGAKPGGGGSGVGGLRRRRQSHQPWIYNRHEGDSDVTWADAAPAPEPRPATPERRPYWRMRLIRDSIRGGARLSPKVFVPKEIWVQVGYKTAGLHAKEDAIHKVHYSLARRIHRYDAPTSFEAAAKALAELRPLLEEFRAIQDRLHVQFGFIPQWPASHEEDAATGSPDRGGNDAPHHRRTTSRNSGGSMSSTGSGGGGGTGGKHNSLSGRFRDVMGAAISLGVNVAAGAANAAMTTRERITSTVPALATEQQLVQYKDFVCNLCDTAQILDEWWLVCESRLSELRAGRQGAAESPASRGASADETILVEVSAALGAIATFMDRAILELVFRDMNALLKRYILKMRKSFARMYFDEVPMDLDAEGSRQKTAAVEAW